MLLKKGHIYKIKHYHVSCGRKYPDFTAITDCIIFSPFQDMVIDESSRVSHTIESEFLVTFDMELKFHEEPINFRTIGNTLSTCFYYKDNIFVDLTKEDIKVLVSLFNDRNKMGELSQYLKTTEYRYNRKLDKIIKYDNTRKR